MNSDMVYMHISSLADSPQISVLVNYIYGRCIYVIQW